MSRAGTSITVNNTENIDAERRNADTKLNVDARNELRKVTTVATGSPDRERHLTEGEIDGLLQVPSEIATQAARVDVAKAEEDRRKREQQIPPR